MKTSRTTKIDEHEAMAERAGEVAGREWADAAGEEDEILSEARRRTGGSTEGERKAFVRGFARAARETLGI